MKRINVLLILVLSLFNVPAQAQYCMLPGRTIYSPYQPGISQFKLNTINRTSGNVEKPMNEPSLVVTGDSTVLERGKQYTVTIVHTRDSVYFPTARNNIRVWVDYNKDTDWSDAGETVISADFENYGTFTGTFTVPATAALGKTRLRATAKMSSDAGHTLPTSCDIPADPLDYHGEMEDYFVTIVAATDVSELSALPGASIFPNPAESRFSLRFTDLPEETPKATLLDLNGKTVSILLHGGEARALSYEFDLSTLHLARGLYLVRLETGEGVCYHKLFSGH